MSQEKGCVECEAVAGAVGWTPILAKTAWKWLPVLFGVWAALGVLLLAVREAIDMRLPYNVGFVLGFVWFSVVVVVATMTIIGLAVFVSIFLRGNVFPTNRGIYLFLDMEQRLHRHLVVPIATAYAATPAIIGIGVGRWLRKTVTLGAPWQNWKVVGEPTVGELIVMDQHGCKLPGDSDPSTVLAKIAAYTSVREIIEKADYFADIHKQAFTFFGIHVEATILAAIVGKGISLSPQAKVLRERLVDVLNELRNAGHVTDATLAEWSAQARQLLEEERKAALVQTRGLQEEAEQLMEEERQAATARLKAIAQTAGVR